MTHKPAPTEELIHEHLTNRWSPYVFDPERSVSRDDLAALFEAARWTMSSYNEQPWRFIVGIRDRTPEIWEQVHQCLLAGNQGWAQHAPILALGLAKLRFDRNGKPNKAAAHDLGAASASLTFEATHRGLHVHQMVGIDPDKVISTFKLSDEYEPLTALAIGYAGDAREDQAEFAQRDSNERRRRTVTELLLAGEII